MVVVRVLECWLCFIQRELGGGTGGAGEGVDDGSLRRSSQRFSQDLAKKQRIFACTLHYLTYGRD